jgi:hypothetical protein
VIHRVLLYVVLSLASVWCAAPAPQTGEAQRDATIRFVPCPVPNSSDTMLCGKHVVFENRTAQTGRRITLNIVGLPALGPKPVPIPCSSSSEALDWAPPAW